MTHQSVPSSTITRYVYVLPLASFSYPRSINTVSLNCPMFCFTLPGRAILGGAAFLQVVHLMPFTATRASSLPPDSLTTRSNSSFGGCPQFRCKRLTLCNRDLVICFSYLSGISNSIPPSGISDSPGSFCSLMMAYTLQSSAPDLCICVCRFTIISSANIPAPRILASRALVIWYILDGSFHCNVVLNAVNTAFANGMGHLVRLTALSFP